jgi:hypothetical protein
MTTIVAGVFDPIWYALTGGEPSKGRYTVPEDKSSAVVDPRNEFLGSLLAAGVAAGEYFALRVFMAQMPNIPTAVAAGFLFYQGMGSLMGYQSTDLAMSVWLGEKAFYPYIYLAWRQVTVGIVASITAQVVVAVSFFFHRFACIGEFKTPYVDGINKQMHIPEFKKGEYAFDVVVNIYHWVVPKKV